MVKFLRRISRFINVDGKIITCRNWRHAHFVFEEIRKGRLSVPSWVYSSKGTYIPLRHMYAEPRP